MRLQLWWSLADDIVVDQVHQSAHFHAQLRKLGPRGELDAVTGHWPHTGEVYRTMQLPAAVRWLGLVRA